MKKIQFDFQNNWIVTIGGGTIVGIVIIFLTLYVTSMVDHKKKESTLQIKLDIAEQLLFKRLFSDAIKVDNELLEEGSILLVSTEF